jgi:hypothetical protein
MKTLQHAQCIHDETLTARKNLLAAFKCDVAHDIDLAKLNGRFLTRFTVHLNYSMHVDAMVTQLKHLGYAVTVSGDTLMISWREPRY